MPQVMYIVVHCTIASRFSWMFLLNERKLFKITQPSCRIVFFMAYLGKKVTMIRALIFKRSSPQTLILRTNYLVIIFLIRHLYHKNLLQPNQGHLHSSPPREPHHNSHDRCRSHLPPFLESHIVQHRSRPI